MAMGMMIRSIPRGLHREREKKTPIPKGTGGCQYKMLCRGNGQDCAREILIPIPVKWIFGVG